MKVTIITAVFNGAATLDKTIQSVISQTYPNIEHIVIDGASTDGSVNIAKSYTGDRCRVISEKDRGLYDALNKGISLAEGEIIGILNADDVYVDANLIEDLATHFASDSDLDCIYGDLNFVAKKKGKEILVSKWIAGELSHQKLKYGWMPPHPTIFFRRSVYKNIGCFDIGFQISSDYDLILRAFAIKDFKSKYIPRLMVNMQLGGLSNRSWKNIATKMIEDYSVMKKNKISPITALFFKNMRKWGQASRLFW